MDSSSGAALLVADEGVYLEFVKKIVVSGDDECPAKDDACYAELSDTRIFRQEDGQKQADYQIGDADFQEWTNPRAFRFVHEENAVCFVEWLLTVEWRDFLENAGQGAFCQFMLRRQVKTVEVIVLCNDDAVVNPACMTDAAPGDEEAGGICGAA